MRGEIHDLQKLFRASHEILLHTAASIPEAQRDWKPNGQASSLIEIMRHLCEWESRLLSFAEHGDARDQIAVTPESHPDPDGVLSELKERRLRTEAFLDRLSPTELNRTRSLAGRGVTVRELLIRQLRHEHYHVGQIQYLHFLLGLHPEEGPLPHPPDLPPDER
jgi:uncharacterized damage-inducible protein DinB